MIWRVLFKAQKVQPCNIFLFVGLTSQFMKNKKKTERNRDNIVI